MKISLEHCLETFKNKEPHEDAKKLEELKEAVHDARMRTECEDDFKIDKDDYEEVLDRFKKKNKKNYDLVTKSSESFKNSVFKLIKRMVEEENFPKRFDNTVLQQLWKRKGEREDLNNH
jgi:uncharacterized protein (DUF2267 family)